MSSHIFSTLVKAPKSTCILIHINIGPLPHHDINMETASVLWKFLHRVVRLRVPTSRGIVRQCTAEQGYAINCKCVHTPYRSRMNNYNWGTELVTTCGCIVRSWGILGLFSAFTKSLASEQSRDITFAAPVPWFQIETLTLTLTNTPNHTLTLTRSQTLTRPRNKAISPV